MKVFCHIEEGICRYLDEYGIRPELLLNLAILTPPNRMDVFLKSKDRVTRCLVIDCGKEEFNFLFTEAFDRGNYIGELMEEYIVTAFFQYICR